MTSSQHQQARREQANAYRSAQEYCANEEIRLSRDPVEGYWLHYDGKQRFVRFLSDVRGTVDWICDGQA